MMQPPTKADKPAPDDAINPKHYQSSSRGLQVIDIIDKFKLDFYQGTIVQYVIRAGRKTPNAVEDIDKAIWYLKRYRRQVVDGGSS